MDIEILHHITHYCSPSILLRLCILNSYWFYKVFSYEHWKLLYYKYEMKYEYLPAIKILIPNISLFCRLSLKKVNGVESVWNPKSRYYVIKGSSKGKDGRIGQDGKRFTTCGPQGKSGQVGEKGPQGLRGPDSCIKEDKLAEDIEKIREEIRKQLFPTIKKNRLNNKF